VHHIVGVYKTTGFLTGSQKGKGIAKKVYLGHTLKQQIIVNCAWRHMHKKEK
jgi:hypothetical protein